MMKGLESVHIRRHTEAIDDGTMRACAKRGVARLSVWNGDGVTEEALLDFCFSNTPTNGDATERTLFMRFFEKRFLSKNFLRKLVKVSFCFEYRLESTTHCCSLGINNPWHGYAYQVAIV